MRSREGILGVAIDAPNEPGKPGVCGSRPAPRGRGSDRAIDNPLFRHTSEGPDDMPAHVRAALTATTLSIPVAGGVPALGTWQGIYLYEHRRQPHTRRIAAHLIGE